MFLHVLSVIAGLVLCIPLLYAVALGVLWVGWLILSGAIPEWLFVILGWALGVAATVGGISLVLWGFGVVPGG